MSQYKKKTALVLYKMSDLRLLDHHPLHFAHTHDNIKVCHVFFFDLRFTQGISKFGNSKMTSLRSKFLRESVQDLQLNLQKKGSDLYTFLGQPENLLPKMIDKYEISSLYYYQETCQEEQDVLNKIQQSCSKINPKLQFMQFWGNTLYDIDDLPFSVKNMPTIYTDFRKQVEQKSIVKDPLCIPKFKENIIINECLQNLPDDQQLGVQIVQMDDKRSVLNFQGGETQALNRLNDYFWKQDLLKVYKETRNGMLGPDYSSKFSPWLALGCFSPRYIIQEIKKYEQKIEKNESTYWLFFELLWRDFFKFHSIQQKNKIFQLYGTNPNPTKKEWKQDKNLFEQWQNGLTGYPLIDANMRELKLTGFMSNRGRQIVASFLVNDMGLDWRMGAQHFEAYLLDYDPCSNYGNWTYCAGVGSDPRQDRYFNVVKQGKNYDPQCRYIVHWLPFLENLSNNLILDINQLTDNDRFKHGLDQTYVKTNVPLLHSYFDPKNKMKQQHGKVEGKNEQKQNKNQIKQKYFKEEKQESLIDQFGVSEQKQKKKRNRNKNKDQ